MIIIILRNSYAIAIESERQFWGGCIGENGDEIGLFGEKTYKDPIGETDEKKSLQ